MPEWTASSPFERLLWDTRQAGDTAACLALLQGAEFALPITGAAAAGDEPPAWATVDDGDLTWLLAFTSVEAMEHATEGAFRHCRIVTLVELAAGWPDLRWRLAVNPGLPPQFFLESGTVARLAVPGLVETSAACPDAVQPVLQKLLTPRDIADHLHGETRVSGYVHQLLDVAHIATPAVLVRALGEVDRAEELLTGDGSVNVLRWRAVDPRLYRTPYGGTDEEQMTAVGGWVIEEAPFRGMGLARNPDQVIREYKVDGVELPHGAELWELGADGRERRRAVLDGDVGAWRLVSPVPDGVPAVDRRDVP